MSLTSVQFDVLPQSMDLRHRSDRDLLADLGKLVGSQRELTARLVAHLDEIEERRLHLREGFSSMFEFCVKELRMGEGEAFRRILAARLLRRFPVIFRLLETGALHLSALELLRKHLNDENHLELLEAASGKSKRELEALLAARFPRPDVPERIRAAAVSQSFVQRADSTDPSRPVPAFALEPTVAPPVEKQRARLEPLSSTRYRIELTVSAALRDTLEICRDLLSHANPTRGLESVVERAVDLLLADLERTRLARTKRPRRTKKPPNLVENGESRPSTENGEARSVRAATRREVFSRDGLRCTFVSPSGRRCEARAFLELDHDEPRALGGGDDASNLRVRCRAHNQLWAEEVYGREHVESARRGGGRRDQPGKSVGRSEHDKHFFWKKWTARSDGEPGLSGALDKVRLALKTMGFTDRQARRAIDEVSGALEVETTVEQALRKAVLVATRAA